MANEKRLIDANAIEAKIEKSFRKLIANQNRPDLAAALSYVGDLIIEAPTVDAVEVVHGRWEIRSNPYRVFAHEYACSVCGGYKHKLSYEHENMNYCPNCGAKMDGDGDECVKSI